jgi:hypothetical protein
MSDQIDRAIEGAVREMLDGEPRADLQARVMAAVEAGSLTAGSRTASPLRWIAVPLAAAAIVILAVVVARRSEPIVPQAPAVAHGVDRYLPSAIAPTPAPALHVVDVPRPSRPAPPVPAPSAGVVTAMAVQADDGTGMRVDALKPIAAITFDPLEQDRIAPAAVAVRPLNTITDIQIAPLTPPQGR